MHSKMADLISNGAWKWPIEWNDIYDGLINVEIPSLNSSLKDRLYGRDINGCDQPFSVHEVWKSIREIGS